MIVIKCNILLILIFWLFLVRLMKVFVVWIIMIILDYVYVCIVGFLIMYLKKLNYLIFCFDFFLLVIKVDMFVLYILYKFR